METKFNKFQIAAIKSAAKSVAPLIIAKQKLVAKQMDIQKQIDEIQSALDIAEAPIKAITGGYTTEDLINVVTEETDKLNADGTKKKVTKYVLRYPETVIPMNAEEPTSDTPAEAEIPQEAIDEAREQEAEHTEEQEAPVATEEAPAENKQSESNDEDPFFLG